MASTAWLAYVPIPGLGLVAAWTAPEDRHTRYHARQGGWLVGLLWIGLFLLGLLGRISDALAWQVVIGVPSAALIIWALIGIVRGIIGTVQGTYPRVRPLWDLLARFSP